MQQPDLFITVVADVIVAAISCAVVVGLGLLMWLVWRLTVRAVSRIRPAKRPAARVVAELGADGRDSGRTRIGG